MANMAVDGLQASLRGSAIDVPGNESPVSAVSWAAVFAGAFVALSVSLVLVALASGFGLSALSPWSSAGAASTTFVATAIGMIVVQWLSAGMGGYITGRLRAKWVGVHTHEVFFRDTAHGLLTWALATIVGTVFLASAASSVVSGGVHAAATAAAGGTQAAASMVSGYDVDSLFRSDKGTAPDQRSSGEVTRILASALSNDGLPAADRGYLSQMIATRTGISQADAEKRVDDVVSKEKAAEAKAMQAADTARKAAAGVSIGTALSMLIGAFITCVAAAYGGSLRDEHVH